MKIALLGNGNVGRPTFDIIYNKQGKLFENHNIEIKYVLIKSLDEAPFEAPFFVTKYDIIENDPEIEVVFEMMGARVSYDFIKRSLLAKKHVITANKEVIAAHFSELQEIANEKGVKLFFDASVGGSIPIINTLISNSMVNNVYRIEGILNGTTNFMLTSMFKENLTYDEALRIAQQKGFAEADPTADVMGLDMVRKIAILSQIAYHGDVDYNKVYSYGITGVTKGFIDFARNQGYCLKYLATSELHGQEVNMTVEPILLPLDDIVSNVNYEYNIIRYYGDHSGIQMMYGKGAGALTSNALVNDLDLLLSGFDPSVASDRKLEVVGNRNSKARYLLHVSGHIDVEMIEKTLDSFVVTKMITGSDLVSLLPNISFYAKIVD